MSKKPLSVKEAGSIGGKTTLEKHGASHFSESGKKGGNKLKEERGSEYFKRIRQIGIEKKKKAQESPVNRIKNILTGKK